MTDSMPISLAEFTRLYCQSKVTVRLDDRLTELAPTQLSEEDKLAAQVVLALKKSRN